MSADLQFTSALDDSAFSRALRNMEAQAGSAAHHISESFEGMEKSLQNVSTAISTLGEVAGLGIIGEGIREIIEGTAEWFLKSAELGHALSDQSEAIGMNAEEFQGFSAAAEQAGSSQEQFIKGMVKLNGAIESAKNGNLEMVQRFEKLGISLEQLDRMSPGETFIALSDALHNSTNYGSDLATVLQLIGNRQIHLAAEMREGGEEIKQTMADASKLSDQQVEDLKRVENSWLSLSRTFKVESASIAASGISAFEWLQKHPAFDQAALSALPGGGIFSMLSDANALRNSETAQEQLGEKGIQGIEGRTEENKIPGLDAPLPIGALNSETAERTGAIPETAYEKKNYEELSKGLKELSDQWDKLNVDRQTSSRAFFVSNLDWQEKLNALQEDYNQAVEDATSDDPKRALEAGKRANALEQQINSEKRSQTLRRDSEYEESYDAGRKFYESTLSGAEKLTALEQDLSRLQRNRQEASYASEIPAIDKKIVAKQIEIESEKRLLAIQREKFSMQMQDFQLTRDMANFKNSGPVSASYENEVERRHIMLQAADVQSSKLLSPSEKADKLFQSLEKLSSKRDALADSEHNFGMATQADRRAEFRKMQRESHERSREGRLRHNPNVREARGFHAQIIGAANEQIALDDASITKLTTAIALLVLR